MAILEKKSETTTTDEAVSLASKSPFPIAEPHKKRLLLQAFIGIISGAVVTFGLVWGIMQGLQTISTTETTQGHTLIALIATTIINSFLALFCGKKFFLFACMHLIASTIILSFMAYILYSFTL